MTEQLNTNSEMSDLNLLLLENNFYKDAQFLEEVLAHFKNTSARALKDMRQQLIAGYRNELAQTTHKLKGSALNFTQSHLIKKLMEIELNCKQAGLSPVSKEDIDQVEGFLIALITQLTGLVHSWNNS